MGEVVLIALPVAMAAFWGERGMTVACGIGVLFICFFFQAEDGIRDLTVTGVQTCALPICVFTIGFGTTQPAGLVCTAQQLGADSSFGRGGPNGGPLGFGFGGLGNFGTGGGFAGGSPLRADQATLQQVADRTGGTAYRAEDADQLQKVFAGLPKDVSVQH